MLYSRRINVVSKESVGDDKSDISQRHFLYIVEKSRREWHDVVRQVNATIPGNAARNCFAQFNMG
jgi:hypothetical protein